MPKLPKSLRIAHTDFRVEDWQQMSAVASKRWGEFSVVEHVIRIQTADRSYPEVLCTLLHEIVHAICWAYEVRTVDRLDKDEHPDTEERLAGIMATAWTQIFRDNRDLVLFIEHAKVHSS